jgi:hypothetical protein
MFYRVQFNEEEIAEIIYESSEPFEEVWDNCIDITESQKENIVLGVTLKKDIILNELEEEQE